MALTRIEYGALASSEVMNDNFDYLDNRISTVVSTMSSNNTGIYSNIASLNSLIAQTSNTLRPLGQPILRLDDTLLDDEIRLEGAAVSRTTYAALFAIYGIDYGEGDGVNTFNLPDFRDRAIWGSANFGYLASELPNIKGNIAIPKLEGSSTLSNASGALYSNTETAGGYGQMSLAGGNWIANIGFDASRSSSIYKDSGTVRPASISVRVVTRYK